MYKILKKEVLSDVTKLMDIEAPHVARKAKAGQFVIVKIDEQGERIPLTIADYDREAGTITIIFQELGKSTMHLGRLEPGDALAAFAGPLGHPTEIENFGTVVNFLPIVLGNGKIHLEVAPELSSLDASLSVNIATAGSIASAPGFRSRSAQPGPAHDIQATAILTAAVASARRRESWIVGGQAESEPFAAALRCFVAKIVQQIEIRAGAV